MKKDRISLRMTLLLLVIISLQSTHVLSKKSKESSNKKSSTKKKTGLTGFIAGRLNPDPALELSRINGFYTPEEASTLCEKNLECAGFTFRGSKNVGQKFRTYFFRFVGQKSFEDAKRAVRDRVDHSRLTAIPDYPAGDAVRGIDEVCVGGG